MSKASLLTDLEVADRLGDADRVALIRAEIAALDVHPSDVQTLVDASLPAADVTEPSNG